MHTDHDRRPLSCASWRAAAAAPSRDRRRTHGLASGTLFVVLCLAAAFRTAGAEVLTGIDVLAANDFRELAGARVGLITNHTGVDRSGRSTAERLYEAGNVSLVRIFSPEHGYAGVLDEASVGDSTDPRTGVTVVSLYGKSRRPSAAMLADIDTLVFDIQDVGVRFYTYISTMGNAMQAAADHGIRFVVLDRPNPVNGTAVSGPVLDDGKQSFVGFHTLPVRHGMTVGELARMFRADLRLDLDLQVIAMRGWRRRDYFDETGLAWIDPSPNIRSLDEALLYPGIGLLETTNLSVGRGTETPFEVVGAPWLNGDVLAAHLQEADLAGLQVTGTRFTPESSVYAGRECGGIRLRIADRAHFDPVRLGLAIARYLATEYPQTWDADAMLRLLGNDATLAAIKSGSDVTGIESAYAPGLASFLSRRAGYLIYR